MIPERSSVHLRLWLQKFIFFHWPTVEYLEAFEVFFSCIFRRAIAYVRSLQKWKPLETSCVDKLILYRNILMPVQMQFPKMNSRGIKVKLLLETLTSLESKFLYSSECFCVSSFDWLCCSSWIPLKNCLTLILTCSWQPHWKKEIF